MRKIVLAFGMATALMVAAAACGTEGDPFGDDVGGATTQPPTHEATTPEPSVAYKLAVIDGDPSNEAAFQDVLDCIKESGLKGGETEEKIGDTLVASWEESGQRDSFLEWAQAFC